MAFVLSDTQRIDILIFRGYGNKTRTYQEVCDLFNDRYPNKPIKKSTVHRTCRRYQETGSIKSLSKTGRPKTATNDEVQLHVLLQIEENPKVSTNQLATNAEICQKSVRTILKENQLKPYKIHYTQELLEDDPDRRNEFAEIMMENINRDPYFAHKIVFSDEATFCLNGQVNRHNCRIWSRDNPHWMEELHTQYPQKVNVWAGILGNNIIGPFFIEGALTGQKYLELLRESIVPAIEHNRNVGEIWYQHDGAPPHYSREAMQFLNNQFPGRLIGRRGALEWPPRSPDMTPLDFFLWGHLKNRVYKNRPENLEELCERIRTEIALITPNMLSNTLREFYDRLGYCLANNGAQFEHLIKN